MSREPDPVTICCSFVPANCPRIACVIDEGGWMVREYMNMLEVAAMMPEWMQGAATRHAKSFYQLIQPIHIQVTTSCLH